MMTLRKVVCISFVVAAYFSLLTPNLKADDSTKFKSRVKPFLENYCFDCHGEDTQKGDVAFHELNGINANNARLWKSIWEQVALKEMPPKKKLPNSAVEHLAAWINMGAPIPDDGARIADQDAAFDFEKFRREHWAFHPVVKPELPVVESREEKLRPIDAFVLARMQGRLIELQV